MASRGRLGGDHPNRSPSFPIWSTIIIAIDVIVLYALTARWSEMTVQAD